MREHLLAAHAASGRWPERLDGPPLPAESEYALRLFAKLHQRRSVGVAGVNPLMPSDVQAFCRQMALDLSPVDFQILYALDDAFIESRQEEQ